MAANGSQPPLEESIALLERTPRVLHELLAGLPDSWLTERDTPDGWTARDVVGHLISAELDDWIPRAEIIVNDGTSRAFDSFDRFAHIERDRDASLHQVLDRFSELRAASIERIRDLVSDDDDLQKRGLHPEFGEVTLGQHIATWTVHDLDHIAQIYAALAGARDEAVGPWKAYLGILWQRRRVDARLERAAATTPACRIGPPGGSLAQSRRERECSLVEKSSQSFPSLPQPFGRCPRRRLPRRRSTSRKRPTPPTACATRTVHCVRRSPRPTPTSTPARSTFPQGITS